jgi:hypothetical protein
LRQAGLTGRRSLPRRHAAQLRIHRIGQSQAAAREVLRKLLVQHGGVHFFGGAAKQAVGWRGLAHALEHHAHEHHLELFRSLLHAFLGRAARSAAQVINALNIQRQALVQHAGGRCVQT